MTEINIPCTVKSIGNSAFYGCSNLKTVQLNEGLQIINNKAFAETPIEQIIIPNSVTSIKGAKSYAYREDAAFYNCTSLKTVVIGTGITSLEQYVFYSCTYITQVNYTGSEEQWNIVNIQTGNDPIKKAPITFNYKPE